jgi:hypothetical protein
MTQVLPDLDRRSVEARPEAATPASAAPVMPYATPGMKNDPGGRIAIAGLTCGIVFFALVAIAGVVHPDIGNPLLAMIITAPLASVVLGSVASQRAKKAGNRARRSARGAVWLGGAELALVLAFGIMIPSMCRSHEPANRAKCGNNLRQIGLALLTYANNNGGRFPDTLNVLLDTASDYEVTADVFVCPSTGDERAMGRTPAEQARNLTAEPGHLSYVYVGAGLTTQTATGDRIIAYDNPHNHNDEGINVLYGDAHTEFLNPKQAVEAMAKLRPSGSAPATRPAGATH